MPYAAETQTAAPAPAAKTYHCGTLSYTLRGLLILFAWLLWGDFCFTLMEIVVPSILPLKLKALGAPSWVMAVILSTLPGILNMTICPWVSFKSDRYRSRWGRRIPFILWTLPLLCLCLAAMGWTEELAAVAHAWLPPLRGIAPATLVITLLAVFMVAFSFFNMYVNSVFWYLFNDVVPARFLGRFFGLFRMVGTLAGALYSAFVFKYAESHMREIFTGAAVLYFIGFGLVCLRVREGEYPPPPVAPTGNPFRRLVAEIRSFSRESFVHRFYWYFYLMLTCGAMGGGMSMFGVFFNKDMGLSLDQIGKLGAAGSMAAMAAMYFAAIYVDRWHPLRITVYFAVFSAVGAYGNWIWLVLSPPPVMYFWLGMAGIIPTAFGAALNGNASLPLFMRLLPPSRYGQICSASSLISSMGTIVASLATGALMDGILWLCRGSNYGYRFIFLWGALFSIGSLVFTALVYREWKKLGGDDHYRAPAPWSPEGFEDMSEGAVPVPSRPRWLLVALHLFTLQFVLQVLFILVFLFLLQQRDMAHACWWNAWVFLPATLLLLGGWLWQANSIRRDVRSAAAGDTPANGVPHHGVVMAMAVQGLLLVLLGWAWRGWFLRLGLEREIIWFGVAALVPLAANLLAFHLLRLIERAPSHISPLCRQ